MISNQTLVAVRNTFKKLMFSLFFLGACSAFAQVGVGTQNPQTALHVAGVNAAASGTAPGALAAGDGVIVTRVTTDLSGGAVTTGCSAATQGAMVYSTNAAGAGYYTCNGASWEPLSSGGGGGADFTIGSGGILNVDVTATPDFSANTDNNVLNITASGNGPGSTVITLPTPASNAGRIIVLINRGAKGVTVGNSPAGNLASSLTGTFFCTGAEWVKSGN